MNYFLVNSFSEIYLKLFNNLDLIINLKQLKADVANIFVKKTILENLKQM